MIQAPFTRPEYSLAYRIFSYYVILFPSVDIISVYPLSVHVATNNIYPLITKHSTSEKHNFKYKGLLLLVLRFVFGVIPVIAALGLSNLIYIINVAGFLMLASYVPPFLLQARSIQVCKQHFVKNCTQKTELLSRYSYNTGNEESSVKKKKKCCGSWWRSGDDENQFRTPYSYPVISHQITAVVLAIYGVLMFTFLVAGLFVKPQDLTCTPINDPLI